MNRAVFSSITTMSSGKIKFKDTVIVDNLDIDSHSGKKLIIIFGHVALKVDYSVSELITMFEYGATIEDLYNTAFKNNIAPTVVDSLICRFTDYGLFVGTNGKSKKSELLLKTTLLSSETIAKLRGLQSLFSKKLMIIFSVLSTICILFALIAYYRALAKGTLNPISPIGILLVLVLIAVSGVVHELGHSAALMKYGGNPGAIGIGIYIATIVAYSDVNEAWRLKAHERLVVDYGGIYLQSIFSAVVIIAYFITDSCILFYASICLCLAIITNCLPVLKLDGYWVACDYFRVDNINQTAKKILTSKEFRCRFSNNQQLSYIIYLTINLILTAAFICYFAMLFFNAYVKLYNLFGLIVSFRGIKEIAKEIVENLGYVITALCCAIAVLRLSLGLLRKGFR